MRSMRARRVLADRHAWLLLLGLLAACADGDERDASDRDAGPRDIGARDGGRLEAGGADQDGELEVGQGELAFAPLADGDTLPTVAGGQGGHHVFVSFRMRGLDPMRVLIAVTTAVEGHPELELLARRGRQSFVPEGDGHDGEDAGVDDAGTAVPAASFVYLGWPAQIRSATMYRGERATIDVMLEDRNGLTASASKTIVIGDAAP
jgi:hypothetical protein